MHGLEKSWISIKRCLDRFIGCLGLPICICWHQGTSLFEISPEMIRFLKFILDPWMNIFLFNILHPFSFFLYSNQQFFLSEVITHLFFYKILKKKKTDSFDHFSLCIFSKYSEALYLFSDVLESTFQFKQLISFLT